MARRRTAATAGGSLITLVVAGILGYAYVPGFAPLVDRVTSWVNVHQVPDLPDAAAAGSRLASDVFDALHHGITNDPASAASEPGAEDAIEPTPGTPSLTDGAGQATPTGPSPTADRTTNTPAAGGGSVDALAALEALPVSDLAPMTGYSRERFGPAWTDEHDEALGRNGCDTRNDILARDLHQVSIKTGSCQVAAGTLHDPYTGADIAFTRGQDTSAAVQIDHVVPLGNAWATGAQHLPAQTRIDLANDPLNLLAVSGPVNEQKSDGDAAAWLPPDPAYRCPYVSRQVAVKVKYDLWVTSAEHDAIAVILASCPGQLLPDGG